MGGHETAVRQYTFDFKINKDITWPLMNYMENAPWVHFDLDLGMPLVTYFGWLLVCSVIMTTDQWAANGHKWSGSATETWHTHEFQNTMAASPHKEAHSRRQLQRQKNMFWCIIWQENIWTLIQFHFGFFLNNQLVMSLKWPRQW